MRALFKWSVGCYCLAADMENEIQFDQVQQTAASVCSACRGQLLGSYFQANGHVLCERCASSLRDTFHSQEGQLPRVAKATALGIGGGLAGGAVYATVLAVAHINAALITILIGWLVGKGVSKGCGGRGGLGYQILAVALTWLSIGFSATLADVVTEDIAHGSILGGAVLCLIGAFIGPVLMATSSILGGVITFFGLMRAWQMNRAVHLEVTGPHLLASSGPAVVPVPTLPTPLTPRETIV